MKKLALLLSMLVLLLAIIPCCLGDNCPTEKGDTEQTDDKNNATGTNGGLCSPFFQCHSCPGFALNNQITKLVIIFFPDTKTYPVYQQNFVSIFSPSIWQPPRIA